MKKTKSKNPIIKKKTTNPINLKKFEQPIKLNLGCENDIKKGFVNIDIDESPGVDLVWDLNKIPLPFKNNSVEYILCSHTLMHLNNPYKFLLEMHRICKKSAIIDLFVPHFSGFPVYADFGAKKGVSYFAFGENWCNKDLNQKFKVIKKKLNFTRVNFRFLNYLFNPIINANPLFYERFLCFILPCTEVFFKLQIVK